MTCKNLEWLFDRHSFCQNCHDFIRAAGGDGFTPVVGFSIVFFMQVLDGESDGGEAAKEQMAHRFVLMIR